MVARVGRTGIGRPLVRSLGALARCGLIPSATAGAIVNRAWSQRADSSIDITRTLGDQAVRRLHLDLRYSGCVELLVAPAPGAPDVNTTELLIALARNADLFVDVGANVGLYTYLVAAATPATRVISVEPTPALADLIASNVVRNDWQRRVTVRRVAVGATRGTSTFYVLEGTDTENTLEASRIAGRHYRTIAVPVVTVDDLLAESMGATGHSVLKIDVEGHESSALDGMARTLSAVEGQPVDVIMEFLGRAIHDQVIERVLALDINVYYIGPAGLTELRRSGDLEAVHSLGFWNFLLTRRPPSEVAALAGSTGLVMNA
jgi:FkbM family methyltransferase